MSLQTVDPRRTHDQLILAKQRSPADGVWKSSGGVTEDVLVVLEVMTNKLDRHWWRDFRRRGEALFRQDELVVRSTRIDRL